MDALATINLRNTPQTMQADPRQVKNSAGGFTFTVDAVQRLRRFLVLGTDGGTYYTGEKELTEANAAVVLDWARNRGVELVAELVTLSTAGRAPKQNPTLFALAAAASLGDVEGRKAALDALPLIARTGTHLFLFARYVEQFRGWGRGLRRAVADWYLAPDVDKVAYQSVKYRQREGWSHRDLLRLSHPVTVDVDRRALFDWICGRDATGDVPAVVEWFEEAQAMHKPDDFVRVLEACPSLSWEMLPDVALGSKRVWRKLIDNGMPQTALMRQLPRLTRLGVLKPLDSTTRAVCEQLADPVNLAKGRIHPVNVLVSMRTYASGYSARGDSSWTPIGPVVDALDSAFYAAFGAVRPANKRTLIGLDVSGSMGAAVSGLPITCREAATALSMVTAATEKEYGVVGFTGSGGWGGKTSLTQLPFTPRQRMDDILAKTANLPFGTTDCALPIMWATQNKVEVDSFFIYTDNETYAGSMHPRQALRQYRDAMGIDARLAVVGMTATDVTIAEPGNPMMLDVAGFDSAVPNLLSDFSAGLV